MKLLVEKQTPRSRKSTSQPESLQNRAIAGTAKISTFHTPMGWMGLLGLDDELASVFVGHPSAKSIKKAASRFGDVSDTDDWNPMVRGLLEAYAAGEVVDFSSVELRLPAMTPFRQMIISATRQIRYGETTTYGQLAQKIGHPGAARAVGTVMSTNRFPIIIPCHRVLAAGGNLGGYTSPAGLDLKLHMLSMEEQGSGISLSHVKPKWMLGR